MSVKTKLIRITTVPSSIMNLLEGQLRYMSNYYEVIAVSSDGECYKDMLKQEGVRGYKVRLTRKITPFADFFALVRLIIIFIREKPDIVHTHTPKAGIVGMLAARIAMVPIRLHTVAGLPLLEAKGVKRILLNMVEKITYACATNVYPNSFEMRDIILKLNLTKNNKLKVIANGSSNGIDTSFFSLETIGMNKREFRAKLNIDDDTFVFLFIGRIVRDKGINELVRAFSRLFNEGKHCKLVLVGKFEQELNPITAESMSFITSSPGVLYVGYQNDVRPYLAASDALVFPSYREGFPNVVMQAGSMNLASIVSDINGCNEIIKDRVNGIIIPPHDDFALFKAMELFVENPNLAKEYGTKARSLITSRYERQNVWDAMLYEYKSLLKNV